MHSYEDELKRLIREECKSIQATTIIEAWLKQISREQFEDPAKLQVIIKKLNEHREDAPTSTGGGDEAGSDPSSSSDSDNEGDGRAKASGSGKPEEDAERKKRRVEETAVAGLKLTKILQNNYSNKKPTRRLSKC